MKKSFKDKSISIANKKISVRMGVSDEENAQIKGGTQMKKLAVIMVAALLLAGCAVGSPAPVDTSPAEAQDIDAIVQQSVDEAIAQYEAAQKARDAEIADLKAQLEELTSQEEEPSDDAEPEEAADLSETAPVEETPQNGDATVQGEIPTETKPEAPGSSQSSAAATSYGGFDLKNLYPSFVWDNIQPAEDDYSSDDEWEQDYEDEDEDTPAGGILEADALEMIRLTNLERENRGLEPLAIDNDLMALAQIRAEEVSVKYSHERPNGTRVVVEHPGYGENVGGKASAEKQVASWMSSEGHCANILRERFHRIGVGCYQTANGSHYWVQVFAP